MTEQVQFEEIKEIKKQQAKLRELDKHLCSIGKLIGSMEIMLNKNPQQRNNKTWCEKLYEPTDKELNNFTPEVLNMYYKCLNECITEHENTLITICNQLR